MTIGLVLSGSAVLLSALALLVNGRPRRSIFNGVADARDEADADIPELILIKRVSHELRTPLTSIHGALGLVTMDVIGKVSPEAEEMLRIANENSARMLRLVNDLLEYRRNGESAIRLDPTMSSVAPLVDTAIRSIIPISRARDNRFVCSIEDVSIMLDEDRCLQVLVNILHNAVSFSPLGGTISVTGAFTTGGYAIVIDDEGPGVAEEERHRIFEPFLSLRSHGGGASGAGLGLTIADQIMRAHGGRIRADSAPGGGARFVIEFPVSAMVPVARIAG